MKDSNSLIKVCHLTSVHPPDDIRIFQKECTSLAKKGYDVSLLATGTENMIVNNVKIVSVHKCRSRAHRVIYAVNAVYKKAIQLNSDVYHIHDPELLRLIPGLKQNNAAVIYDAHEDLPRQIFAKSWMPAPLRKITSFLLEIIENYYVKQADYVIAATPVIRRRFEKINSHVTDVNNFPFLSAPPSRKINKKNEICYIGTITPQRGIEYLVDCLNYLNNIRLNLAGDVSHEFLNKLKKNKAWNKVNFMGYINRNTAIDVMNKSTTGMVTLLPLPNYVCSQPTKMFEYMSAGIPVIASDFPLWKEIIEKNNCGICVNPQKSKDIAEAIQYLIDNPLTAQQMGMNGRIAVEKIYNWKTEEKKLLDIYQFISEKYTR